MELVEAESLVVCGLIAADREADQARALLENLATAGDASSVVIVGVCIENGLGAEKGAAARVFADAIECRDGMVIEAATIYVLPRGSLVSIVDNRFVVRDLRDSIERARQADHLLASLADVFGTRSASLQFGEPYSDGLAGIEAVAGAGGLTLGGGDAPANGVDGSLADICGDAATLTRALVDFARAARSEKSGHALVLGTQELREVCDILRETTGHDFQHYKESTLSRRVVRRMSVIGAATIDAYLEALSDDTEEARVLMRDILIGVTSFFRDSGAFEALSRNALANLIKPGETGPVRIWSAGCGRGQEAYSIAMLAIERIEETGSKQDVQIFASDLNERSLTTARRGIYPSTIADEVTPERLRRFFEKQGRNYKITKDLRQLVVVSPHNLIADPPFSRMDLICCRNVLIYLGQHLQKKLFSVFHYALNPGGYLFLGSSEAVTGHGDLFRVVDGRHKIAQRKKTPVRSPSQPSPPLHTPSSAWQAPISQDLPDLGVVAQRMLLDEFAPAFAVVNGESQIMHLSAGADAFLQPPEGAYVNQLMRMTRTGLRAGMRKVWSDAVKEKRTATYDGIAVNANHERRRIRLVVQPMPELGDDNGLYMVVYHDLGEAKPGDPSMSSTTETESIVEQLEADLLSARGELERTVQDLEATNEELKSSNEELRSMNEELQSANEELETSKEEVDGSARALAVMNDDLVNLMNSTEIALIFLDAQGRLRNFTPEATKLYNITANDIGRPLDHFTHRFADLPAMTHTTETSEDNSAHEAEALHEDGRSYLRRITSYRTADGLADGSVVAFVDVSEQREIRDKLAAALGELKTIYQHAPVGLVLVDREFRFANLNNALADINGMSIEQHVGRTIREVVPELADAAEAMLQRVFDNGEVVGPFELEGETPKEPGHKRTWLETYVPVRNEKGDVVAVSASVLDITDRRQAEEELKASEASLRLALEAGNLGTWSIDLKTGAAERNARHDQIFGYAELQPEWTIEKSFEHIIEEDRARVAQAYEAAMASRDVWHVECRVKGEDGALRWIEANGKVAFDEKGQPVKLFGIVADVTARREAGDLLRVGEERLRLALEAGRIGVWALDLDTGLAECDARHDEIFGYVDVTPDWTIDRFFDRVLEEDRPGLQESYREATESNSTWNFTCRIKHPDGGIRLIEAHGKPVANDAGDLIRMVGIVEDVTEKRRLQEALKASQELLRVALESAQLGTFNYDVINDVTVWDARSCELFDTPQDGRTMDIADYASKIHPDDIERVRIALDHTFDPSGDGIYDVEHRVATSDGSLRWLYVLGRTEFDGEGDKRHAVRTSGIVLDVTDRRAVERALEQSAERLSLALDVGQMGIWDWDLETGKVDWTDHHYILAGYEVGSVEPSYEVWRRHIHPDDIEEVEAALVEAREKRELFTANYRVRPEGGVTIHVSANGRFLYDDKGNPVRMIGVVDDVTSFRRAEMRAEISRRQLDSVYANAPVGLAFLDRDLRYRAINQEMADIKGVDREAYIGKLFDEKGTRLGALLAPHVRQVIETREAIVDVELHEPLQSRDESDQWWLANFDPALDADGRLHGVNVAIQDITAIKLADLHREMLLNELNHRVRNSLATIQSMASQTLRNATDLSQFRETFIGRLRAIASAHEILTNTDQHRANLRSLIDNQVGPYVDMSSGRVRIGGPTVSLHPNMAHALGLVLHELTTNAAKYGALSNDTGYIDISWQLSKREEDQRVFVDVNWSEHGGPPVAEPTRKGFGSRLIELTLSHSIGGEANLNYAPDGFKCSLHVPVDAAN